MNGAPERWVPLFPLPLVLLPGGLVPLHIYEPRYRAMTRSCLERESPFVLLLAREEAIARIGCEARIVRVLERYEDGRLDILCQGGGRVALQELREHPDGYLEGRVEPYLDREEAADPDLWIVLERLREEWQRLVEADAPVEGDEGDAAGPDETGPRDGAAAGAAGGAAGAPSPAADAGATGATAGAGGSGGSGAGETAHAEAGGIARTFRLAAGFEIERSERQELLELDSELHRQQYLLRYLSRLLPQIRMLNENRRRIRGNGKPRPPA